MKRGYSAIIKKQKVERNAGKEIEETEMEKDKIKLI